MADGQEKKVRFKVARKSQGAFPKNQERFSREDLGEIIERGL